MVIAELSIYPMDKGEHLSPYVARALKIIKASGIRHEFHAMGTILEGEWSDVMSVVDACYRELEKDCSRIIVNFKADSKRGGKDLIEMKVKSVREKLGG